MSSSYGITDTPGFIVRFAEADLKPQTYDVVEDGWQAVSIGEHLVKNTNAINYWVIDQMTGKICWGNI